MEHWCNGICIRWRHYKTLPILQGTPLNKPTNSFTLVPGNKSSIDNDIDDKVLGWIVIWVYIKIHLIVP